MRKVSDVVVEPAQALHAALQLVLAGVAERRVAEVVGQGHGLRKVVVEAERARQRAGNLGHLQGMGQAGAVIVTPVRHEDLALALEPAQRRCNG